MNKKLFKICIGLTLFLLSIGIVSAEDDLNNNEIIQSRELNINDLNIDENINEDFSSKNNDVYNYTWLNNKIYENGANDTSIDLNGSTVKWNYNDIFTKGIIINKTVAIKNGIIDGSNSVRMLTVDFSHLILENITFKNGYAISGGTIFNNEGNISIINCEFINNSAGDGGTIVNINGELNLIDLLFINNSANHGSVIYSDEGIIKIDYSQFINNTGGWGNIFLTNTSTFINNTIFTNISSKYAGAIFSQDGYLKVDNSNFSKIYSNQTGGAIGLKIASGMHNKAIINNSNFIDCGSQRNGGAIFSDNSTLEIYGTDFINCSSEFGGALVSLNCNLSIFESNFINNHVVYDGGAIYLSFSNVSIIKTNFISNYADSGESDRGSDGGALFLDYSNVRISDSKFINNSANFYGGAISTIDIYLTLINNSFYKNFALNGSGIYCEFSKNITLIANDFNNHTLTLNNTPYISVVVGEGIVFELVDNSIILRNYPSRFDLRDFGWVSPVKNQGSMGACWTFATLGALESALLKATDTEYDFSENNMQNSMLRYSRYGVITMYEGGEYNASIAYLLSWLGAIPAEHDVYDELGKLSTLIYSDFHFHDIIFVPPRINSTDNDLIKNAIIKYGSLSVAYYGGQTAPYYDSDTAAHYYNEINPEIIHGVSVVGWDDNYSKDNFIITPPGDGAFIVKNSWGTSWGDDGYFYVSYYDTSFSTKTVSVGYIINNTENYNKNYQYDISGYTNFFNSNSSYIYYSNQFIAEDEDLIAGVGTYFPNYENEYEIQIFVNNELKHSQIGNTNYPGYSTIKLNKYIPIKEGDIFKVVIKTLAMPYMAVNPITFIKEREMISRVHIELNNSFMSYDGENWQDLYNYNATACIKVYTLEYNTSEVILNASDISMFYKDGTHYSAILTDIYGTPLINQSLEILLNGVIYNRTTNENGTVYLAINLFPKNYTVTTTYKGNDKFNNISISTNLAIKSRLISNDLIKFYKNQTQYEVKVLDEFGNGLSNASLELNINGVKYYRNTDGNGIARLNINLDPGNYTITALFNGLNQSNKIEVLKTLIGKDLIKEFNETYDVLVLDGQGNPFINQEITININGIFYNRTSDSNGIARLNINLDPGSYIATANWNGYSTSNYINVKP